MPDVPLTEYVCHVSDEQTIRLVDLPDDAWDELEASTGESGFLFVVVPLGTTKRARTVYEFCCRKAGVEPATLTIGELWDVFELVADDRPTSYSDGLPDPKADDQTTEPSSSS